MVQKVIHYVRVGLSIVLAVLAIAFAVWVYDGLRGTVARLSAQAPAPAQPTDPPAT